MTDTLWITKSIGEIQETIIRQLNGFAPNETDFAMAEQNVLQGDPAIPIFGHDKVTMLSAPTIFSFNLSTISRSMRPLHFLI